MYKNKNAAKKKQKNKCFTDLWPQIGGGARRRPRLSRGEREGRDITLSPGVRAHLRGAYVFGLLAFVLFPRRSFSLVLFSCKATDSLQNFGFFFFFFFLTGVLQQKQQKKSSQECLQKGKEYRQMLPFKTQTKQRENKCNRMILNCFCSFQNSGIEQCCLVLFEPSLRWISWTI